jgi:hypothetical protein
MAKIKNVSPLGDLYVPAIGIEIAFGETTEVPDELAASLLEQPANWVSGDSKETTTTPAVVADSEGE